MWSNAIEDAIEKVRKNIDRFGGRFPHVSMNGTYQLNNNDDWTNGFWSGMLWLCYEYTQDDSFRIAASHTVEDFRRRFAAKTVLDHHDIGFLYSLSSKAQWIIDKDESARQLTLQAADLLLKRWRTGGGYIQAWGPVGDAQEGGRIIIDCLLNLPLLYWAEQQTGDSLYRQVAVMQADKTKRYLVREMTAPTIRFSSTRRPESRLAVLHTRVILTDRLGHAGKPGASTVLHYLTAILRIRCIWKHPSGWPAIFWSICHRIMSLTGTLMLQWLRIRTGIARPLQLLRLDYRNCWS